MNIIRASETPLYEVESGDGEDPDAAAAATEHLIGLASGVRPALLRSSMFAPLLGLASAESRRLRLHDALVALGFNAMSLMLAESMDGALLPVCSQGALPEDGWCNTWLRRRHHEVDPRLHDVAGSGLPCLWDLDSLRDETLGRLPCERAERFIADLAASGARSGVLFALRGGAGSGRSLVDLRSSQSGRAWMNDGVIGAALLLAVFALEHGEDLAPGRLDEAEQGTLTELQHGILHCLRLGMSDKIIADRLGLSRHNVDYHLRKLRLRFGVRNRMQLVQAAQCASLQNRVAA